MAEEQKEGAEQKAKEDEALVAAKKVFRIVDRKPASNDKLRKELVFDAEWDDPEDGVTKTGMFRALRPNIGMASRIDQIRARMDAGLQLQIGVHMLHFQLARLEVMLVEAPPWWKPEEFFDNVPIAVVFDHLRHWESSFRR